MDKTKIVGIIDGLEAAGLVSRRPDPDDDRRARIIEPTADRRPPTADRRKRLRAARAAVRRLEDDFLSALSPARCTMLLSDLHDLGGEPAARLTAGS
ncbi:hypothetical protein B0I31_103427 [Saccharothrix carnea]|uniref:MarR family protein n=1 Tax=Saccharothrix carnea TaxID=1280637 RepID=A0A2P8IDZ3_SACCR|nr:hypothetical protein B0I31_103427 [Saccharothrix carnea]